ncbi:MAG TPA: Hsp33 family molecular chaperone HslO [Steroidobacteraceae bacterium]|jgi:molecular chaperone Hsp33
MAEVPAASDGELRRFILERQPVRGFRVRLEHAWRELRSFHRYPRAVEALLGEAVTASLLLAATLKFQGTLTLQLAGDGLVSLLVAQCTHEFSVRAVARAGEPIDESVSFRSLVGEGRLTVTIEAEERAARYQGIVALEGESLAQCLENYFATSEQLPTLIALAADAVSAGGVLLQKIPGASAQGEALAAESLDIWETLQARVAALEAPLLRLGSAEQVLQRVCGEHDCRLFVGAPVQFACRCSQGRVAGLLRSLGPDEMRSILAEQGAVTVTCEFCGRPYRFDAIDVERLFSNGATPEAPHSVN